MGANYDLIILSGYTGNVCREAIEEFLLERGFDDISVFALDTADIDDASAVLVSLPFKGHVQIVADIESLGIPIADWFESNCFAAALSRSGRESVHLWSLDSGFVAGYSAFADGSKVEGDVVFSNLATNSTQLMDGVPVPTKCPGEILGASIARKHFDFSTHIQAARTLEIGICEIVSMFGFDIHLVDFFEALDEQKGIAIENGKYYYVPLKHWTAIQYAKRN